jgi:cleavage stimulation factor subunit 2
LRIDLADSDPFLEEGELVDGGVPGPTEPRTQWRTGSVNENRDILASVSAGTPLEPGVSAQEAITQTLASGMSESQLIEVLAQMKVNSCQISTSIGVHHVYPT